MSTGITAETTNVITDAERVELARAVAESDIAGCSLENEDIDALVDLFESWLERRAAAVPQPAPDAGGEWYVVEGDGVRGPVIDIADSQGRCVARCRSANESIPLEEARANAYRIVADHTLINEAKTKGETWTLNDWKTWHQGFSKG